MNKRSFPIYLIAIFLFSCKGNRNVTVNVSTTSKPIPVLQYKYIRSYPHDTTSFTEGFLFHDGKLFESTGSPDNLPQTRSLFGIVNLKTGSIEKKVEINSSKYFGEGIAFLKGKVYQLTYKSKIVFVYDAKTYKRLKEYTLPDKEGWGLTTDGTDLIMSDGTYQLSYLSPNTLNVIKKLTVTENGTLRDNLNELEFIKGDIFANIWQTNTIVKIDTANGNVTGTLDLKWMDNEVKSTYEGSLEMNGIAYDPATDKIYLTGKLWPKIYEIEIKQE